MLLIWLVTIVLSYSVLGAKPRELQILFSEQVSICETLCTGGSVVDERMNCIHKCLSPDCFRRIYGPQPLEDGEIDEFRKSRFTSCVTGERRAQGLRGWSGEENVPEDDRIKRDSEWLVTNN